MRHGALGGWLQESGTSCMRHGALGVAGDILYETWGIGGCSGYKSQGQPV